MRRGEQADCAAADRGYNYSMKLPHADRAEVDIRKLRDYCLSDSHPVGKHKAVVFQMALGLRADDAELLRDCLLRAAGTEEADAHIADEFGARYRVDFNLVTDAGSAIVQSAWIVRTDESFPQLVTCFILPRSSA